MLKKLLKYEFKATARTYGGMYLALLAASVLFGGSVWRWNSTNSDAYSTLVGLLSLVYTAVIIGTVVVTIMTIVQRFYRNLLGREGYLMHTLPVTETQLVTSKLISSTVWSLCSILAACLSFGILAVLMMADMDLLEQLPRMWSIIREAFARYNMEFWVALAFSGVVSFVRMVSVIAWCGTSDMSANSPSWTCCWRHGSSSVVIFTVSGSSKRASCGSLKAMCPFSPIPSDTMSSGARRSSSL